MDSKLADEFAKVQCVWERLFEYSTPPGHIIVSRSTYWLIRYGNAKERARLSTQAPHRQNQWRRWVRRLPSS